MKTMEMVLKDELFQLKQLTESAKKRLETAPKGGLRITKKQNRVEYYYKESRRDVGEREKDRKRRLTFWEYFFEHEGEDLVCSARS